MVVIVVVHVIAFLAGLALVLKAVKSTIQTLVVPRAIQDGLATRVFFLLRVIFDLRAAKVDSYVDRDSIMAFYAPISLLALVATWLVLVMFGFTLMDWGLNIATWRGAFLTSGSSLLTLGFAATNSPLPAVVLFAEAAIGLLLVALLITYLPTIYAAWQRREQGVALLETRAGSPPSGGEMILRFHRIGRLEWTADLWPAWETWFLDVEESHTTLAVLSFFRSAQPNRSWVTAAGALLDGAALLTSTVDVPRLPQRELCLRAGFIALQRIAAFFQVPVNPHPSPDDPVSVTRAEFDEMCDALATEGVPLKPDRDQAWRDFAGWRVNYDAALLGLARLTMASYAPWISDRSVPWQHPAASRWPRLLAFMRRAEGAS